MNSTKKYWDNIYRAHQVRLPDANNPILLAALEHCGGDITNCRVLDLGCGLGEASIFFAERGASITSVDNSDVAISKLRAYCAVRNITNVTPIQVDAVEVADIGPFDFIFGSMILHHIEPFDKFALTLRSALRPGGKAFFYENSAMSSLLIWFREHLAGKFWLPKVSDEEEFPLTPSEIQTLRKYFSTEVIYPELLFFRLIPAYLFRGKGERPFRMLDDLFYRVPLYRQYSYRQYILLS